MLGDNRVAKLLGWLQLWGLVRRGKAILLIALWKSRGKMQGERSAFLVAVNYPTKQTRYSFLREEVGLRWVDLKSIERQCGSRTLWSDDVVWQAKRT